ncbi:germ cell nuclear acidic protein-like isoform X4 [Biomphalaria glabrata]|uniref:Germ cell nuclear acidic protein-like isoform X4 n=1 Tax=Biomphalaria glabrata TaxID=6526 RepID=A0A9W2YXC4_BIOGL|nr:germ cell nuclear acidic protein-like isoform X4 [Biomphalaria glabrata]
MKQIFVILCMFAVSYNFGLVKARPSPEVESDANIDISEDAANNETEVDDVATTEDPETEDAASNETQWEVTAKATNIYSDNVTATENPETDKDVSSDNKNVSSDDEDVSSDNKNVSSDDKDVSSDDKDVSSDNKNVSSDDEDVSSGNKNVSSNNEDVSSDNKVLFSNDTLDSGEHVSSENSSDSEEEEDTYDFSQWRYKLKNIFSLRIVSAYKFI